MPAFVSLSSFILAASLSTLTYLALLHRCLKNRINHEKSYGSLPSSESIIITTIPPEIYTSEYYALHDRASRRVPRQLLPHQKDTNILTIFLRRNMMAFANFPQAYMLWAVSPAATRPTFHASHISSLDFNKGDLTCGIYRVLERTADKVEFGMTHKGVEGRLVFRLWDEDKDVVFTSETAMWTRMDEMQRATMPLENPVLRFFHELAAWWLLDSGVKYLVDWDGDTDSERFAGGFLDKAWISHCCRFGADMDKKSRQLSFPLFLKRYYIWYLNQLQGRLWGFVCLPRITLLLIHEVPVYSDPIYTENRNPTCASTFTTTSLAAAMSDASALILASR
ncbi:hypothetical protein BO94DRAFT_510278 [Aspergillus sclerotioniger CBS 115572]|uniref:Uncharacterized protein n=1 Tax=Aspergillus sclerotioniger CBS 115572 TaxID=1450535 RepID=A0A317X6D2_9EURO|nr:hypothetical protein BO94DRAFT_510278 [Aspergillus sclerotioniger CBS 115572]PWY94119.1 hypothetical protein BO94DRAFT_510278 [Aspergillus sclerotioniger CBS 115572]